MNQISKLIRSSAILLLFFFLSQDICLWSAPAVLNYPSMMMLSAGDFTILALCAAIPACLVFAIRAAANWRRRSVAFLNLAQAAVCVLFAVGYLGILVWCSARRTTAFTRASANGGPIIAALNTYRDDNGVYPNSLSQLVPQYVPSVPRTGLIGYPTFTFPSGYNDISPVPDSYELRIECTSGGINFDRFIYWPSESYPKTIQGNWTERIGTWVYVHE